MALDAISTTGSLILNPLISLWNGFVGVLPGIIAAIIVLIIGYFVALGVGHAVKVLLEKAGLDGYLERSKFAKGAGHFNLSRILGEVTKWYIFLIFIQSGVDLLRLGTLSSLLNEFVRWLPNVIVAAVVLLIGILVAKFLEDVVRASVKAAGLVSANFLGALTKWAIFIFTLLIALNQLKVAEDIIRIVIIGVVAAGSIALGLAFGMGGVKHAESMIGDLRKRIEE